jgi:iron complex outermembrane receptor protein
MGEQEEAGPAEAAVGLAPVAVVGSRLRPEPGAGLAPVRVLQREDIARSGAGSVRELINQLSASNSALSDVSGASNAAAGGSALSLRHLGRQAVLVLVDGRRTPWYPLADNGQLFTHVDALPLAAVHRVEVLRSGGAAVHGSEAIAGVINLVTLPSPLGVRLQAHREASAATGAFGNQSAALNAAWGNLQEQGWHVGVHGYWYQRDAVMWGEVLSEVNPAYFAYSSALGSRSSYSAGGNVATRDASGSTRLQALPQCPATQLEQGLCMQDRYAQLQAQPDANRATFMLDAQAQHSPSWSSFAQLWWGHTRNTYLFPGQTYGSQQAAQVWAQPQTLAVLRFKDRGLPAQHPLNNTGAEAEFRYRFDDVQAYKQPRNEQWRALAGARGQWDGHDWEWAVGLLGSRNLTRQRGPYSLAGFREVIGDPDAKVLDPRYFQQAQGYRIGGPNSEAVLQALFPEFGSQGHTGQRFADARLSGQRELGLFKPAQWVLGLEWRQEWLGLAPYGGLERGDIVGQVGAFAQATRQRAAVFSEWSLEPAPGVQLQTALRLDRDGGYGSQASPRLSLGWPLGEWGRLRGSVESGFRAPSLAEAGGFERASLATSVSDPQRCPSASRLAQNLQSQAQALPPNDPRRVALQSRAELALSECGRPVIVITAHNPRLQAETSRSAHLGWVKALPRQGELSIDHWRVERHQEITTLSPAQLLAAEAQGGTAVALREALSLDPVFTEAERLALGVNSGRLLALQSRFANLNRTRTAGLDIGARWRLASPWGLLGLDVDASRLLDLRLWSATGGWGPSLAGLYGFAHWKSRLTLSQRTGRWSQAWAVQARSGTRLQSDPISSAYTPPDCEKTRQLSAEQCRLGAEWRLDFNLAWRPRPGLALAVNVQNVLSTRPPVDYRALGVGGTTPPSRTDAMGRLVKLSLEVHR